MHYNGDAHHHTHPSIPKHTHYLISHHHQIEHRTRKGKEVYSGVWSSAEQENACNHQSSKFKKGKQNKREEKVEQEEISKTTGERTMP